MALTSIIKTYIEGKMKAGVELQAKVDLVSKAALQSTDIVVNADVNVQIQVTGIVFSVDTAGMFELRSNDNRIWLLNMNSSGGIFKFTKGRDNCLCACNLGESLKIYNKGDMSTAVDAGIYIKYRLRDIS